MKPCPSRAGAPTIAGMNALARLAALVGIHTRDAAPSAAGFIPQRRDEILTDVSAVHLAGVYRALSILTTSMGQLSLTVERAGVRLDDSVIPGIIRRPNPNQTRREFIEALTLSLATTGNAYIRIVRFEGVAQSLQVLNPAECFPVLDPKTGEKTVSYRGAAYRREDIEHIAFMPLPGRALGLGPIQAARAELAGIRDVRDYASNWFTRTGQPAGILTTDQKVTQAELTAMRNAWNLLDADGNPLDMAANPTRVRALANGAKYEPIIVPPKDAQWVQAQQFGTTQIARIFGIPAPLMLAAVEGNAQTYSNVEQEWIAFTRFTLAAYMRAIEDALTEVVPRGQTVRFNVEALLRTDTKARYEAHKLAIEMGLYDAEYARKIEGITL